MTFRLLRAAALAGASVTIFTTSAFAQIETIVVTAEKRSENIQTVPIASVFPSDPATYGLSLTIHEQ